MQLRPRHFVLLALIAGLFVFNIYRHRRAQQPAFSQQSAPVLVAPSTYADPAVNNAWIDFEHAAALRDAPAAQFQPMLDAFNKAQAAVHTASAANSADDPAIDLQNCKMWLTTYRSGVLTGPNAHSVAAQHVDRCVRLHRDAAF